VIALAIVILLLVVFDVVWAFAFLSKREPKVDATPKCYGKDEYSSKHTWGPFRQGQFLGSRRNGTQYEVTRNVKTCTVCGLTATSAL
jgi:hypothetical protein